MDASFLLAELAKLHDPDKGWIFIPELRLGTGYGSMKEQRLDAWAIQAWTEKGVQNLRRSFEIKVSTADLIDELRNPDKRWAAYAYSHEFYFVTPWNLVRPSKLSRDDGLIEWRDDCLKITKPARTRSHAAAVGFRRLTGPQDKAVKNRLKSCREAASFSQNEALESSANVPVQAAQV